MSGDYFDRLYDDLQKKAQRVNKFDPMYYPEWRDEALEKSDLPYLKQAEADLIFYKSEVKSGVKFSSEENEKYRQLFVMLKRMREAA